MGFNSGFKGLSVNVSRGNMCTVLNLQGNMSISYNNILICVTSFTTRIIKILNVSALLATPYITSLLGPITS
jgi:hypothetical protein